MVSFSRLFSWLNINTSVLLATALLGLPCICAAQGTIVADSLQATWRDSLQSRWVGRNGARPLFLDFYGDTMVVVNDTLVSDHRATRDSLVVVGDTSFSVHYRLVAIGDMIRMILITESGDVITMSQQKTLARPLRGNWIGNPIRLQGQQLELRMRGSGTAGWRSLPGGSWTWGEWDRFSREITFTWLADTTQLTPDSLGEYPDSITWVAIYDPERSQLLFEETVPGSGVTILRRYFRRPRN